VLVINFNLVVLVFFLQNIKIPKTHVKRMSDGRIPKLIMEWIPEKRRKRGQPGKTWMEGVQAAMTARNLEQDQWKKREEWCLVSGRWRQLL
jgi:hypothetical protein